MPFHSLYSRWMACTLVGFMPEPTWTGEDPTQVPPKIVKPTWAHLHAQWQGGLEGLIFDPGWMIKSIGWGHSKIFGQNNLCNIDSINMVIQSRRHSSDHVQSEVGMHYTTEQASGAHNTVPPHHIKVQVTQPGTFLSDMNSPVRLRGSQLRIDLHLICLQDHYSSQHKTAWSDSISLINSS